MVNSKWRGHDIFCVSDIWYYKDSGIKVSDNSNRKCGHCNKENRKDEHDACLGKLVGVMNACCGHGIASESYIQFLDGNTIHGKDAVSIINILKKYSNNNKEESINENTEKSQNNIG